MMEDPLRNTFSYETLKREFVEFLENEVGTTLVSWLVRCQLINTSLGAPRKIR
jgi:hypothetical protein